MTGIKNKIIAITSDNNSCPGEFEKFADLGAKLLFIPTIRIVPLLNYENLDTVLKGIESFDYLLFTSSNAVAFFFQRTSQLKINVDFRRLKAACVGDKTAESCKSHNIPVSIIPESFSASSLAEEFKKRGITKKRILIPCSAIAREELKSELVEMGNEVLSIPVYDVQIPSEKEQIELRYNVNSNKIDLIAFTSPSSFHNFRTILKITKPEEYFNNMAIAAIGNTTKDSIEKAGVKVNLVPEISSLKGLTDSIIEFYN